EAWTLEGGLADGAEAVLREDGSRPMDRAMGLVGVATAYRRQGLGSRLAEEVERFAASNACRWVEAEVRERNLPVALPFIGPRGYVELERYRTSVQTPSTVDLRGLDDRRRRLGAVGVAIAGVPAVDSP